MTVFPRIIPLLTIILISGILLTGCASTTTRTMKATGYCGCGQCCGWERGSWKCLKLDVWNRYVSAGPNKGRSYSGLTASGTRPRIPRPGLISWDTARRPWMLPVRLIFPWLWLPRDGTIAADTRHHPFGTRMYVPGWGYGRVEDRGSAITGPDRLDLYFNSHSTALQWGVQRVSVDIYPK
jgi:hypothetical protein